MEGDHVRQLHEGLRTQFCEPNGREEVLALAVDLHFGEAQPRWDLR